MAQQRDSIDRLVKLYKTSPAARQLLDHVLDVWDAGGEDAVENLLVYWEREVRDEKARERHVVPKPREPEGEE
jgi:hypothetical protein